MIGNGKTDMRNITVRDHLKQSLGFIDWSWTTIKGKNEKLNDKMELEGWHDIEGQRGDVEFL